VQVLAEAQAHAYEAFRASVLVIAFPGGSCAASLQQQARRCAFRSLMPVVVEVGRSFEALHLGQQAKPAKASKQANRLAKLQHMGHACQ
jgi:hypothetical protein